MKFFVVMIVACLMGGNVHAQVAEDKDIYGNGNGLQSEPAGKVEWVKKRSEKLSLIELITDYTMIYQLTDNDASVWHALIGGKKDAVAYLPSKSLFTGRRAEEIWLDLKKSTQSKVYSPGNLTLFLWDEDLNKSYYLSLWNYKADLYKFLDESHLVQNSVTFPKYPELRTDLIWLCKNRYLLKLLKKGELTTKIYHFTPRQMQLLVKLCPQSWMKNLHAYAKSESYASHAYRGDKLDTLYSFLNYDPTKPKEFPLLDANSVRKLAFGIDGDINYLRMFPDAKSACLKVNEKLIENQYLTQGDKVLLNATVREDRIFSGQRKIILQSLQDRIIEKADVELLKISLQRMEWRQSPADLVILAELVQSKTFLEGIAQFQRPIMKQFELRKEKEVVWILAPLLKHKGQGLADNAKMIMQKLTSSDLGNDPAAWRAWYSEQNK